jgi:hypothetical protein
VYETYFDFNEKIWFTSFLFDAAPRSEPVSWFSYSWVLDQFLPESDFRSLKLISILLLIPGPVLSFVPLKTSFLPLVHPELDFPVLLSVCSFWLRFSFPGLQFSFPPAATGRRSDPVGSCSHPRFHSGFSFCRSLGSIRCSLPVRPQVEGDDRRSYWFARQDSKSRSLFSAGVR